VLFFERTLELLLETEGDLVAFEEGLLGLSYQQSDYDADRERLNTNLRAEVALYEATAAPATVSAIAAPATVSVIAAPATVSATAAPATESAKYYKHTRIVYSYVY
jgi:hypothetical protein